MNDKKATGSEVGRVGKATGALRANGARPVPKRLDEEEFRLAQEAVHDDLRPTSKLQEIYADNIAEVIADIDRKRRHCDARYLELGRKQVWKRVLHMLAASDGDGKRAEAEAKRLALGWMEQDDDVLAILGDMGLTKDQVLASVEQENAAYFHGLDLAIERLEKRQRNLMSDYHALETHRRLGEVEDAEIL
jgi:hypothetical protein